jgi:hypothetical protein
MSPIALQVFSRARFQGPAVLSFPPLFSTFLLSLVVANGAQLTFLMSEISRGILAVVDVEREEDSISWRINVVAL